MLKKKAKRILAGLCVALMLTQSIGESTLVALAAENEIPEESSVDAASPVDEGESVVLAAAEQQSTDTTLADGFTLDEDGKLWVKQGEQTICLGTFDQETGTLTIAANISTLSDSLFKGWTAVKIVRFEENAVVKALGANSFKDCTGLTEVDFTNCSSLTQIYSQAFSGCSALTKVTFNSNLQYIETKAFEKCTALASVDLVPGLISIGASAFSGCSSLTSVKLETANVTCGTGIFSQCNLTNIDFAITVAAESEDGTKKNIIVPANLFSGAAFAEDADIELPATIQEIGKGAFQNSNLQKFSVQNTQEKPSALSTISESAFSQCKQLTSIAFPDSLQTIGVSAFSNCTGLTELVIPNSVNSIGNNAFSGCSSLVKLTLSNGTTAEGSIGSNVFQNCTSLAELVIPEGLTFTGDGEFQGCTALSSVSFPETMVKIGNNTFKNCASFTAITLPDSVVSLGSSAFESCILLQTVNYSQALTTIGASAFKNCTKLTSNTFPETLDTIGASAFENCQSFSNQTIPANVTTIGNRAFASCIGIDILTIEGKQLSNCGTAIFYGCMLRKVNFPEGIETIPANLFSQARFTTDAVMTIPATVTTIGKNAFGGNSSYGVNISKVEFETSKQSEDGEESTQIQVIDAQAFAYCTALEEFVIPESTTEIGASAFEGCKKISSIVIPENVTKIGAGAFSGCEILTDITYNAIAVTTSNQNIFAKCNIKRIVIGNQVALFPANLFRGAQFSTNAETGEAEMISLQIPASVEKIGEYALPNVVNLQRLQFEEGFNFTAVEQYAFSNCVNLTYCNLPESVTTIGNYAFAGCKKLGSDSNEPFVIPAGLTTLGSGAFSECSSLTEAEIPAGVAKISDKAFQNAVALKKVTLTDGTLTNIDVSAFEGCTALEEIVIPNSVAAIGAAAFKNDTALKTVTLAGGSLKTIGNSAFEGCTALEQISIPNGVTAIKAATFKGCSALNKVVLPSTVTSIAADAFSGCDKAEFFVLPGSYAEQWLKDNGLTYTCLLTITYELNDGVNAPENPLGFESGDTFSFSPATRNGYTFAGWYLDEDFKTPITGVTGCTESITIYAKWEVTQYTITYVLNGGTNNKDNPATYTILDTITLQSPEKAGANFEGWYTDLEKPKSVVTAITKGTYGDITLYAKWSGGQTAAPQASIADGTEVRKGTKLLLTCATPGAVIFYTLDGTVPTAQSTRYLDGITINQAVTVKAIAIKESCEDSEVVTFTYQLMDETTDWGDLLPEDQAQYNDATKVPDGIWVAGVADVVYTGKKITFDNLRVYDHTTLLTEKKDYTVKYTNNTNAADKNSGKKAPSVTITAKGNYKGKDVVYFTIAKLDISGEDFSAEDLSAAVTGKLQKPVPVLYYGKTKLKNKKDYQVVYGASQSTGYQSAGEYDVTLVGNGNYTGERHVKFTLANAASIAKAKITGLTAVNYTGEAITQKPTVTLGGETLTEGTHYDVVYSNNINAGTATVSIVGKGSYCGTKKATFKILPVGTMNKVNIALSKTSVSYTGEAYELGKGLDVTATFNGNTLKENVDYTCTYTKNRDAGTATIVFTGMGGYTGTAKKTFKIVGASLSKATLEFLDDEGNVKEDTKYGFVQDGVKPAIRLTLDSKTLVEGTDYTVSYANNTEKGTAELTVKGKKNYQGTLTQKFTIERQSIAALSVYAGDVVYKNAAGVVEGTLVTVMDANGRVLVKDEDYKVSYTYANDTRLENGDKLKKAGEAVGKDDIVPLETQINVKVTGNGNYDGTKTVITRVCQTSIASAKVTVQPQSFTGSAVCPGVNQITVKLGRGELQMGEYVIVGYSNNVKKGTAKVILQGTGNYGGIKIVNFQIKEKPFALLKNLF